MEFLWFRFEEFTAGKLYDLLAFRQDVFIVEQDSAFQDLDGIDRIALHLLARDGAGRLVGCARCVPPSPTRKGAPSFGRLVVARDARGTGLGRRLVALCLDRLAADYPGRDVVISAQAHLEPLYASFGFLAEGGIYDDGGIAHLDMRLAGTLLSERGPYSYTA